MTTEALQGWLGLGLFWLGAGPLAPGLIAQDATNLASPAPGAELFANSAIPHIRIQIDSNAVAQLRQSSRKYVAATVEEEGEKYREVAIHLKDRSADSDRAHQFRIVIEDRCGDASHADSRLLIVNRIALRPDPCQLFHQDWRGGDCIFRCRR